MPDDDEILTPKKHLTPDEIKEVIRLLEEARANSPIAHLTLTPINDYFLVYDTQPIDFDTLEKFGGKYETEIEFKAKLSRKLSDEEAARLEHHLKQEIEKSLLGFIKPTPDTTLVYNDATLKQISLRINNVFNNTCVYDLNKFEMEPISSCECEYCKAYRKDRMMQSKEGK